MKLQDVLFLIVFLVLFYKKSPQLAAAAGICSLVVSIPLFSFWVFFTAQRLTWYAAAFFLLSIFFHVWTQRK